MKNGDEIAKKLAEVCGDERLSYPAANVSTNAPLALIQVQLESERRILQWVLDVGKTPEPFNAHELNLDGL